MRNYLLLTKPRISLLFAFTGFASFVIEGSLLSSPITLFFLIFAIFLVGGSANALNQYLERDIDKQMERTAQKRPLPLGKISPNEALIFSIAIGLIGLFIVGLLGGALAAFLGLFTILFYSFYYTLYLKPKTPYNIVIGGGAGGMAPLVAWSAATGTIGWEAWMMFFIIFFWTPPHFWALALYYKEDYEKVSFPMYPVIYGDEATRRQILYYSFILIPLSLVLTFSDKLGFLYFYSALILSGIFLWFSFRLYTERTKDQAKRLFGYSILYLLLLFVVIVIDGL